MIVAMVVNTGGESEKHSRKLVVVPTSEEPQSGESAIEKGRELMEQTNAGESRTPLATLLVESGVVDRAQIEEAMRSGEETGERLGEVIVRRGWATEEDIARSLAEQWHLPYDERSAISFDPRLLTRMSLEDAGRFESVPMSIADDGLITVAVAEPAEARFLALRSLLGDRIDFVVVTKTALDVALRGDLPSGDGRSTMTEMNSDEQTEAVGDGDGPFAMFEGSTDSVPGLIDDTRASDFDELARSLTAGVGEQLAMMRAIVVDAEAAREQDREEIARLRAEVESRDRKIESMRESLRRLADSFGQITA